MEAWKRILEKTMRFGEPRKDRTGVGTLALFGEKLEFDNRDTFPAVTLKKLAFGQVVAELACFLRGYYRLEDFHRMGCRIWDGNGNAEYWKQHARCEGDLGRIYGVQWRDYRSVVSHEHEDLTYDGVVHVDQIARLVNGLRSEPHGRRHVVTAWNPGELDQMCLPPCHIMFQVFVSGSPGAEQLDMAVYMRSVDLFLGLPFDVASYALLQRLLAKELSMHSGFLTFFLGDTHIYMNHMEQVNTVLSREAFDPPVLLLHPDASLFHLEPDHVALQSYKAHEPVFAPLNV